MSMFKKSLATGILAVAVVLGTGTVANADSASLYNKSMAYCKKKTGSARTACEADAGMAKAQGFQLEAMYFQQGMTITDRILEANIAWPHERR
ncbi:hypothetical protein ACFWIN_25550 [Streptomyces sp. NPDC127049]|uniref:hypothetical protein n=1 Tax=unclassified Streptomyces TaxID=2593676 RepID=UPI003648A14E